MSDPQISATIDILSRLVGFDTESSKSNLALIDYVAGYLERHAIPYLRLPNAAGDKAALFATIGPNVAGGVVLSGHTDVVPVEGQDWTTPAFELREADGKLYGRGSCDMKGFAACALALAPELKALPLKRPIHIMLSYDEETTCLGVVDAIAKFGGDIPQPAAVIVGEPSEMRVVDAHKGVACFDTFVTGFEVHSSKPQLGVNAVSLAAKLVVFLDALQQEYKDRGDATGRFDPPYTTIHVGNIKGGTARNITAKDCHFEWEFRAVPGLDDTEIPAKLQTYADEVLLPPMRAIAPTANIRTVMKINVPGLAPDPGNAAEVLAFRLTGANRTETVPYGTEAGMFQRGGVPVVVCGPGNINQAHQPDEWIAISELDKCLRFMRRLAADLAG